MTDMPTYKMTINLNVLDHLGINLYSNVAAVLTEVVANSWDADAESVTIDYDPNSQMITIVDDGVGMTVSDMNDKYLKVGYRRREKENTVTAKGRHVMGRKGLGKLSLFSIADHVRIETAKDGQRNGLAMDVARIREAIAGESTSYSPDPIAAAEIAAEKGTRIVLSSLKRDRVPRTFAALRKRLARRFSVIGSSGFQVRVDGSPVTVRDRDDIRAVEFLWHIGDEDAVRNEAATARKAGTVVPDRLAAWKDGWTVRGWVGTAVKPKRLVDDDGNNLNSIVLLAHGRLIQENILDSINDGRMYTKYLTGQLEADFLDDDQGADIATSDRQRIQESDPRYAAILAYLRQILSSHVEPQWSRWRKEFSVRELEVEHPIVTDWFNSLDAGYRDQAKELLAKVGALPIDDDDDRKAVIRDSIMAFERQKLRGSVEELIAAVGIGADRLIPLIAQRDSLEAALYRDIIKSRIEVIRVFQKLVDENEKEKALQHHMFDHMWLIDPTWERADGSELVETRLSAEGVIVNDLTEKEKLGRVDIKYRTTLGKHVIVELKRADRKMELQDLYAQGALYESKLKKILKAQGESRPAIEVVFVIGPLVDEEESNPDRVRNMMDAISKGSRIVHFDALITGALRAYQAYIDRNKELDRIDRLVEKLA